MSEELVRTLNQLIEGYEATGSDETLVHIKNIRNQRPRLAFFCETASPAFMKDIYMFFNARYPTRLFVGSNMLHLEETLRWCDIAWFEWCTDQVVYASKMPKRCKIICRLHRYEAYNKWPKEVNWGNVDALITVGNPYVMEVLCNDIPNLGERTKIVTVFNGVDTNRFAFFNKERGKNIGCVGFSRIIKNPMFLLQCFHKLHEFDKDYKLSIAGAFYQDRVLTQYLFYIIQELGLANCVSFDGHQHDMVGWLQDKHFIVSASIVEGHPVNILEAMSCGVKPIIHTWPGARELFPEALLFKTADEFCMRIVEDPYQPEQYRRFVIDNYSLSQQLSTQDKLMLDIEEI